MANMIVIEEDGKQAGLGRDLMAAKVLVVDDSDGYRKVAGRALQAAGYEVCFAADGLEGLRRVAEERPDIVLLDVVMPEMDGFTVCRQIKSRPELGDPVVIVVTGVEEAGDPLEGQVCGADGYLIKPFLLRELTDRVRAALEKKTARSS
jgi:DNA-binding response OmpR family regulator